jgi:hypothetical protein
MIYTALGDLLNIGSPEVLLPETAGYESTGNTADIERITAQMIDE